MKRLSLFNYLSKLGWMKKYLVFVFLVFVFFRGYTQSSEKIIISSQKMGDGLYDFYAENPNVFPMQLELYFPEFENMTASCELPYVGTILPGKHLLFNIRRTFIDLPGGYSYKYTTRVGAYPTIPNVDYSYQLPVAENNETKALAFNFKNTRMPYKISWGFKIDGGEEVLACREGVVCQINEVRFRDSLRLGDNTLTILQPDNSFAKYELFEDSSFTVEIGDTVDTGDVLGKVGVTKFTKIPHIRFSVYYVNARIDSINRYKIRNIHTYLNPLFTDNTRKTFELEADKIYVK